METNHGGNSGSTPHRKSATPIRRQVSHGSSLQPPSGPAQAVTPQRIENTDARSRRYTSMLPETEKRFGEALRRRMLQLGREFELEPATTESRALQHLQRRALRRAA